MAEIDNDILIRFNAEISDFQDKAQTVLGDLEDVKEATEEASEAGDQMATSMSGNSRAMSGAATVIRQFNPQLGRVATGLVAGHRAARGFGVSLVSVAKVLGPAAVAAGALYAAYRVLNAETIAAADAAEKLAEATKSVDDVTEAAALIMAQAAVITGEMTEQELALLKAKKASEDQYVDTLQALNDQIEAEREELELLKERVGWRQVLNDIMQFGPLGATVALGRQIIFNEQIEATGQLIEDLDQNFDSASDEALDFFKALLVIEEGAKAATEGTDGLTRGTEELVRAQKELHKHIEMKDFKLAIDGGSKAMEDLLETQKSSKGMASLGQDGLKGMAENQNDVLGTFNDMNTAAQNFSSILFEDARKQFFAQKSLQMAQVAMNTASAMMEAAPNPWAVAGVAALGASQLAIVAAQEPPTAHMGLIRSGNPLAPDEVNKTVLTGEAILDRAAVARLGGEQGIRALNSGQAGINGPVSWIVPWKHLDRELGRSARSDTRFSRAIRRANIIGSGRGGW